MPRTSSRPNRLRSERLRRTWSQEQLADLSGHHQPEISDYETGRTFPRPESIKRLANAFGVPDDVVFRWLIEEAEEDAA